MEEYGWGTPPIQLIMKFRTFINQNLQNLTFPTHTSFASQSENYDYPYRTD